MTALDTSVTTSLNGTLSNVDTSITVASNTNRGLCCIVSGYDNASQTNFNNHVVTLDGGSSSDWTRLAGTRDTDGNNNEFWVYTAGEPSAASHTVRITGGYCIGEITVVSVYNLNQTTRYGTLYHTESSFVSGAANVSTTVTDSANNDLCIDGWCCDSTNMSATIAGSGQTAFLTPSQTGHAGEWVARSRESATGASTVMSWTSTLASGTRLYTQIAVALKDAGGGGAFDPTTVPPWTSTHALPLIPTPIGY